MLERAEELVGRQMPDDAFGVTEYLKEIVGNMYSVVVSLSEARTVLIESENANNLPKNKLYTELDRKMHLELKTKDQREQVERLEGLLNTMKVAISVGQSILRFATEEYKVNRDERMG